MGRPLKTRKYQQDTDTTVDQGFPNNGNTNNGYDQNEPGIVGGNDGPIRVTINLNLPGAGTIEAATNSTTVSGTGTQFDYNGLQSGSILYVNGVELGTVDSVNNDAEIILTANAASNVSGVTYSFDTGSSNGYILRQKGKKKFLVMTGNVLEDEGIAAGGNYYIEDANDTDWNALGAGPDAGYGKVFTATTDGVGLTTNGRVRAVGVCVLVDSSDPVAGEMSMEIYNDGDTTYAEQMTNRWVRDYDNNNSPIDNNANNTKYIATIFNNNGNVDPATGYTIVGVENWC